MQFTISTRRHDPLAIVKEFEGAGRIGQLKSVYGFLFDSPLNGGRLRKDCVRFPLDVIDELNARGIGYEFTFNNVTVAEEFFEDRHTNEVLARFEKPLNAVIVAHDRVAEFIRDRYPRYSLRASCIYDFLSADQINDACGRFDAVCVFPEVNHRPEVLDAIREPEKLALFGTSICLNLCGKKRRHHYYLLGQDHIAWYNHQRYRIPYNPRAFEKPYQPWCRAKESSPLLHDLEGLSARGFRTFKITQFDLLKDALFKGAGTAGRRLKLPFLTGA